MRTYRIVKVVPESGTVHLDALPFQPGETVEVIVLPHQAEPNGGDQVSLTDSVLRYDDPLDPIAEDDWSALQ